MEGGCSAISHQACDLMASTPDPRLLAYLQPETLFAISKANFNDGLGSIRIVSNLAALPRIVCFFALLFYFTFVFFSYVFLWSESTGWER